MQAATACVKFANCLHGTSPPARVVHYLLFIHRCAVWTDRHAARHVSCCMFADVGRRNARCSGDGACKSSGRLQLQSRAARGDADSPEQAQHFPCLQSGASVRVRLACVRVPGHSDFMQVSVTGAAVKWSWSCWLHWLASRNPSACSGLLRLACT